MIAEEHESWSAELATIERRPGALGELHTRVERRFPRPEIRERVRRYVV